MENPLVVALVISGLGMSLLFLALAFFYGLLSLMTRTIKGRDPSPEHAEEGQAKGSGERETILKAALVAVALARGETEERASLVAAPAGDVTAAPQDVSPWWALHHQRQLGSDSSARRIR